jgi:hypothetical protein
VGIDEFLGEICHVRGTLLVVHCKNVNKILASFLFGCSLTRH